MGIHLHLHPDPSPLPSTTSLQWANLKSTIADCTYSTCTCTHCKIHCTLKILYIRLVNMKYFDFFICSWNTVYQLELGLQQIFTLFGYSLIILIFLASRDYLFNVSTCTEIEHLNYNCNKMAAEKFLARCSCFQHLSSTESTLAVVLNIYSNC